LFLQLPGIEGNVMGEEDDAGSCAESGVAVRVGETEDETFGVLVEQLDGDEAMARSIAEIVHSDIHIGDTQKELSAITGSCTYSDVGIWVDPIDCTNAYINGSTGEEVDGICMSSSLQAVTVLIGAFDKATGHPIAGVVNQPFSKLAAERVNRRQVWNGLMYWGVHGGLGEGAKASWGVSPVGQDARPVREVPVVVHSKHEVAEFLDRMNGVGTGVAVPGSGYKGLTVLAGHADAYFLSLPTTYKWDTCAVHAIVESMGGIVRRVDNGEPVLYNVAPGDAANVGGFVMCVDRTLVDKLHPAP
jgi:inositol polyphosphate 1-phosphatase